MVRRRPIITPAHAARNDPTMKVVEMTVSTLMPSSCAMKGSVEVALMAIPSFVLLMNQYKADHKQKRGGDHGQLVDQVNDTPASRIVRAAISGEDLIPRPHADHDEILQKDGSAKGADQGGKLGGLRRGR